MLYDSLSTAAGLVFLMAMLDAAFSDLDRFRIPNRVPVALVAAFIPAALAAGLTGDELVWRLAGTMAVFVVCFAMFALRIWGGGDAKLLPAVALWVSMGDMPRFLMIMALVGAGLAGLALTARRVPLGPCGLTRRWGERLAESGHVPYGVAIAAGGIDWWAATFLPRLLG